MLRQMNNKPLIIPFITLARAGGVTASFALVFETDGTQAIGDTYSTDEYGIEGVLKGMVVKALSEDASLPVDVLSLTFEPGTQNQYSQYKSPRQTANIEPYLNHPVQTLQQQASKKK